MKNWQMFILYLAAFLLQPFLYNLIPVLGGNVNLLLCMTVIFTLLYEDTQGIFFGAVFGLLYDLFFGMYAGKWCSFVGAVRRCRTDLEGIYQYRELFQRNSDRFVFHMAICEPLLVYLPFSRQSVQLWLRDEVASAFAVIQRYFCGGFVLYPHQKGD